MTTTNNIKAQIIYKNEAGKQKTTTFNYVNPEAADADVAACLNAYGGLMIAAPEELRIQETRIITE